MTKEGQIIYGGPDHYARLAATKHLRDFLSAGRPVPKQPEKEERRRITLQELEELLREQEAKNQELNVMYAPALRAPQPSFVSSAHFASPTRASLLYVHCRLACVDWRSKHARIHGAPPCA